MADKKHDHYAVLGIEHGATAQDINRAYKRAAAKAHPDKGGTHEKMIAVSQSSDQFRTFIYQILTIAVGHRGSRRAAWLWRRR